ncbi:MAG: HD domain-containing protein [Gemmatimonadota bacterium]|nr:HD domain-containing protein [Gemmatimonadota bacterium]
MPSSGGAQTRGTGEWPLISELSDGDEVVARYVVLECRRLQARTGQPYLKLSLGDRSGTIDGMIWEDADRWAPVCAARSVIVARGQVSLYQGRPQLRLLDVRAVEEPSPADLERLIPTSPRDHEVMERELDRRISSIRDRGLQGLLRRCLGRDTEMGRAFRSHPAATKNHHAYLYGLLEHTLSVAGICERIAAHYEEQGIPLNRELLITGALLHDIGKIREMDPPPGASYTTQGRLIGHIVLGMQMVAQEAVGVAGLREEQAMLVQHLIASHQGKPEWDSPREPQVPEALVLHHADDLDARINHIHTLLAGVEPGAWSEYDRLIGRPFYRALDSGELDMLTAPGGVAGDGAGNRALSSSESDVMAETPRGDDSSMMDLFRD